MKKAILNRRAASRCSGAPHRRAIRWMELGLGIPPTEFRRTLEATLDSDALLGEIESLLQAKQAGRQERQVTVDGVAHPLPQPFLVIATQNPIESEGTYPLPEAQLDRFLLRTEMGYPAELDEVTLLTDRIQRRMDEVQLNPVCDSSTFLGLQRSLEDIHIERQLLAYCVSLVRATRSEPELAVGSSPRGTLALVKLSRAAALLAAREFVSPDDIRAMAIPALAHRVVLSDDAWARRTSPEDVVRRAIDRVAVPRTS